MQLADFPPWSRGLFAVFLILFFFNALYALAFFTAIWHLRIDLGVAILMGTIVGLGIVAWQVRLGFTNLIRSREHRAALEREARQHQQMLDIEREDRRMREWKADLDHVAMRIRAYEEGASDPGTLREAQNKRQQQEKEKKEISASPGPRRTTSTKRP